MVRLQLSKCCVVFPLRVGCMAIGLVFAVLSVMGAINKLIEISLFAKSYTPTVIEDYQDTRRDHYIQAKIIRFSFVLIVELIVLSASAAFIYGIAKERLRFMPPFIVHLSLKVGYYLVHYFDVATKHLEKNDSVHTALRLYTFGLIISSLFCYLWLCCYSLFLEMTEQKQLRFEGLENPQSEL